MYVNFKKILFYFIILNSISVNAENVKYYKNFSFITEQFTNEINVNDIHKYKSELQSKDIICPWGDCKLFDYFSEDKVLYDLFSVYYDSLGFVQKIDFSFFNLYKIEKSIYELRISDKERDNMELVLFDLSSDSTFNIKVYDNALTFNQRKLIKILNFNKYELLDSVKILEYSNKENEVNQFVSSYVKYKYDISGINNSSNLWNIKKNSFLYFTEYLNKGNDCNINVQNEHLWKQGLNIKFEFKFLKEFQYYYIFSVISNYIPLGFDIYSAKFDFLYSQGYNMNVNIMQEESFNIEISRYKKYKNNYERWLLPLF